MVLRRLVHPISGIIGCFVDLQGFDDDLIAIDQYIWQVGHWVILGLTCSDTPLCFRTPLATLWGEKSDSMCDEFF